MPTTRLKRPAVLAVPAIVALVAATLAATSPAYAASSNSVTDLSGTKPLFATASADRGQVPTGTRQTTRIYFASQNAAGMAAYAQSVSSPGNAAYGKYLTPAKAEALYGVSPEAVAQIKSWVSSVGLTVTAQTPQYLEVAGTVGATQAAFGTSIHKFATSAGVIDGTTSDIKIPAALATSILAVSGLSGQVTVAQPDSVKAADTSATAAPAKSGGIGTDPSCSTSYGQTSTAKDGLPAGYDGDTKVPLSQCSWIPSQLREAYGVTKTGLTGKGVTVAVVDAYGSSTMEADADQYSVNHGDKPFAAGQYSEIVTPANWELEDECGGPAGWSPEESLDVEMVHGLAPGANVEYVGANSCSDDDLLAAVATIVDSHSADIITNSWDEIMHSTEGSGPDGDTISPQEIQAYEQVFEQAAIEGIGVQFSAGDCGDQSVAAAAGGANCDPTTTEAQTNWPASDPWATAVGGTALFTSDSKGKYDFELTMGDQRSVLDTNATTSALQWDPLPGFFYFGGGGGTSEDFAQPWYQAGVVPSSLADSEANGTWSATPQRVIPDIAMQGDLVNATLVGMSDGSPYSEAGYGGTSVSSPELAGVMADADQAAGHALGFENPVIYLADNFGVFNDIVANPKAAKSKDGVIQEVVNLGNDRIRLYELGQDTSLVATPGYDDATGVGTPTAAFFQLMKKF